jgi:2-phosphosulfolactate phosphatase
MPSLSRSASTGASNWHRDRVQNERLTGLGSLAGDPTVYGQGDYTVRFDWGLDGALATGALADAVAVVDVLSFTTAVTVAIERDAIVYPYRWRDDSAERFAVTHDAALAGKRGGGISLSPPSLLGLSSGDRIVLPSPNGAAICLALAGGGSRVIAGSLRNANAVAALVKAHEWSVAVIAAGEHWGCSSGVRPCLEDLIGAGAILARLDPHSCSPEARAAVAVFNASKDDLWGTIEASVGGRELTARGFSEDIAMATMLDVSECVPLLHPLEGFQRASPR